MIWLLQRQSNFELLVFITIWSSHIGFSEGLGWQCCYQSFYLRVKYFREFIQSSSAAETALTICFPFLPCCLLSEIGVFWEKLCVCLNKELGHCKCMQEEWVAQTRKTSQCDLFFLEDPWGDIWMRRSNTLLSTFTFWRGWRSAWLNLGSLEKDG